MSVMRSPKARNGKEDIGHAVERWYATRQRNIGNTQEQNSAEDRHHRAGAPDGTVLAISADIHEGRKEEERAEDESEHRDEHRIDSHQNNAANQQSRINGLRFLDFGLPVECLHKSGGILIADDQPTRDF